MAEKYHNSCIVQNIRGPKLSRFLLELRMFSCKFQSVLALVGIVLLETQNFFRKYSHGDLTAKVLALCTIRYTMFSS